MIERKNGRAHGEVFTATNVVQYILDEAGYEATKNLKEISILEPSSGHGAFSVEILKRLSASSKKHNFSFIKALRSNVRFTELNPTVYNALKAKLSATLADLGYSDDGTIEAICKNEDFLETDTLRKYDSIVGNPPYIRHELIPDKNKVAYKSKFGTFRNRADLYVPFFEHSLNLLKDNGILSFICSNRWLYNQYGKQLRELISRHYDLRKILNIEKSSPFDESVIAYPCITTIKNSRSEGSVQYCETDSKEVNFDQLHFEKMKSPMTSSWQNLFLLYDLDHHSLVGIAEQGFKIGIGVATGADGIFLVKGDDISRIEESRLLPIITARDLSKNAVQWKGQYVINPYEDDQLCDLEKYPHLKEYFAENKTALLKRHVAQKSANRWYGTIDKINPSLKSQAKILLPDLTGNKVIFIDEGQYYPHHNIYYITGRDLGTLKVLACLLMSDFIKLQLSQIGLKMNGGLPRFQSQVLRKLKLPNIALFTDDERKRLIKAYNEFDFTKINSIVNSFCLLHKVHGEASDKKEKTSELSLF